MRSTPTSTNTAAAAATAATTATATVLTTGGPVKSYQVGEKLPVSEISISQELIDIYASISGDFNPIHVDSEVAAASVFGGTIAHGCIPMEPVFQSILRWTNSQTLPMKTAFRMRYRAPSRPGDVIHSEAQVAAENTVDGQRMITISFVCANQRGEKVIDGECDLIL